MKHFVIVVVLFLLISACAKEGKGGSAALEGKVMVRLIKKSSVGTLDTLTTYEAQDEKVFIVYGDNSSFDDDTRTSFNGNYKFDYLYKGNYSVFAYSECIFLVNTCPSESYAVSETIEITDAKGITELPTIFIDNYIK
ncbi:MAG: hypothetical protein ACPGVH_05540 [Chitinophagales bacterium]